MPKKKQSFAETFAELEKITAWFESGDVDLEKGLAQFERGLELAAACKKMLADVEQKVTEIKKKYGADSSLGA